MINVSWDGGGEGVRLPVLQGLLPVERSRLPTDALAGLTLAALGIPEVLGYAKIAGMPVVTGLYTMLLPMAVFAVLGSSRPAASSTRCAGARPVRHQPGPGPGRLLRHPGGALEAFRA